MLDAILPAVETFVSQAGDDTSKALTWLEKATSAAEEGAKATKDMKVTPYYQREIEDSTIIFFT